MKMVQAGNHLNRNGLKKIFKLKQKMHWARVVREIRSLRGNVNSKFIEDNRPSSQGSQEYPKVRFGGTTVSLVTGAKS